MRAARRWPPPACRSSGTCAPASATASIRKANSWPRISSPRCCGTCDRRDGNWQFANCAPINVAMMTTLPADMETERLARKLAEAAGKPVPDVVREAIAAKAEADGLPIDVAPGEPGASRHRFSRDELLARITSITDGFASIPVRDSRPADEIIGYDELGLPT